jgi:hypothetical protein
MKTKVIDSSNNNTEAYLIDAELLTGGKGREYKNVVRFNNNVDMDEENTNQYVKIMNQKPIFTNKLTIGFWIYPDGVSARSSGIVLNNEENNLTGVILNANGDDLMLGTRWKSSSKDSDYTFDFKLEKEVWSCVVVVFYASGISRLFVNNVYVKTHDMGFDRPYTHINNLEMGRFCGMIDNVILYSDTLDYGNIAINHQATSEVSYYFNESRNPDLVPQQYDGLEKIPTTKEEYLKINNGLDYYYMVSQKYETAYNSYIENTISKMNTGMTEKQAISIQTSEELESQKIEIVGGINDGVRKYANGKFRTILGRISS